MVVAAELTDQKWDVIVVGTGMGGATLGYALAKGGKQVLFCERGMSFPAPDQALEGDYAEQYLNDSSVSTMAQRDILARAGRWTGEIEDRSGLLPHMIAPFIGSGSGGSSALYGMALERLFPSDFTPRRFFPGNEETSLPEVWPISYGELQPYYETSERLYRVRGTLDPLRRETGCQSLLKPTSQTRGAQELFEVLSGQGLHPYRIPMACEQVSDCQCCQGYLCPRNCKNHSGRVCLKPAVKQHGAAFLDECEVLRLEADKRTVTCVVCSRKGKTLKLRGRTIVLAAGALATPAILLRSASTDWPQGLANRSGLVGRNLMRHFVDLQIFRLRTPVFDNRQKEIAFNDFYHCQAGKLGTVQSFGRLPPASVLARSLWDETRVPGLAPLLRLSAPVVERVVASMVDQSMVLASIIEDPPYPDNRVTLSPDGGIRIIYRVRGRDQARIGTMRGLVNTALSTYRVKLIKQATNNHRIAHACGTCRIGVDPAQSVLDPQNRAHGLDNLYVVDASFFPSSGGTNPALTIAANSLRVADCLLQ